MSLHKYRLGELIELLEHTNSDLHYGVDDVRGVNNLKRLMPTKADVNERDLSKFQIVKPGEFVFNHRNNFENPHPKSTKMNLQIIKYAIHAK